MLSTWSEKVTLAQRANAELNFTNWTLHNPNATDFDAQKQTVDTMFYVGLYTIVSFAGVFVIVCRSIVLAYYSVKASRSLHGKLVKSIMFAKMRFFDTTPTGRLLNRFSRDMDKIDIQLPASAAQVRDCVRACVCLHTVAHAYVMTIVLPPHALSASRALISHFRLIPHPHITV